MASDEREERGYITMKKWRLAVLLLAMACCFGCAKPQEDPAVAFFTAYMEASKISGEASASYTTFANEDHKALYLDTSAADPLVSYEILDTEKINDNLVAISFHYKHKSGYENTGYNFVATVDGEYVVIRNVHDVPEALSENLTVDNYTGPDGDMWIGYEETVPLEEQP